MKKIATILFSFICAVVLLTACSQEEVSTDVDSDTVTQQTDIVYADENTGEMTALSGDFYWAEIDLNSVMAQYYGVYLKVDDQYQLIAEAGMNQNYFYDADEKIYYLGDSGTENIFLASVDKSDFNIEKYATELYIEQVINVVGNVFYCKVLKQEFTYAEIDVSANTWSQTDSQNIPVSCVNYDDLIALLETKLGDYEEIIAISELYFEFDENGSYVNGQIPLWGYEEDNDEWTFGWVYLYRDFIDGLFASTVKELEAVGVDRYSVYLKAVASQTVEELENLSNNEYTISLEEILKMLVELIDSDLISECFIDTPTGFSVVYDCKTAEDYILQDDSNVRYVNFTDGSYDDIEKPEEFVQGQAELNDGYYLVLTPNYSADGETEIEFMIGGMSSANSVVAIFD